MAFPNLFESLLHRQVQINGSDSRSGYTGMRKTPRVEIDYLLVPPKRPLITALTPSATPAAPSTPRLPRLPKSSAKLRMLTPSSAAIPSATRVVMASLIEKLGLLVSPVK